LSDKISVFIFLLLGFLLPSISTLSYLEGFSVAFFLFYFINFIKNFGRSVWLVLDLIVLLACITWLITPLFFYHYYNQDNDLANLWVKTMQVDSNTYYSFVFPATMALSLGLHWPLIKKVQFNYSLAALRANGYFNRPNKVAYQLIGMSLLATFLRPLIPGDLSYILYLFEKLLLLGLLYLFFSGNKPKKYILLIGIGILVYSSIRSGMFGELVYMLAIASIILSLGLKYEFKKKLFIVIVGILLIVLLQSVKNEYRKVAWNTGADISYFGTLIIDRISNPLKILDDEGLFQIAVRFNQGWLISSTMSNVPNIVPFANGETIWQSLAAIAVPRFLWPNKPISGGKANIDRFLGIKDISYSMNIGPIGEAYANFGIFGGIIFMFFYGLFFLSVFNYMIKLTFSHPTIIFWIPLLFFYAIGVESDMLTTINSLVKTAFFVLILWKLYPIVFRQEL